MDDEDVLDRIYAAAAAPETWPDALQAVATRIGGFSGILFTVGHGTAGWICSADSHDAFSRMVDDGWLARNSRLPRALTPRLANRVVTDLDIFTADEMAADPLYQALRPKGWGWFAGTAANLNDDRDTVGLSFERAYEDGPYSASQATMLAALRPHLLRATMLGTRLRFERHRTAAEVLGHVGLPAAVLGHGGRLLVANAMFQANMPALVLHGRGRLRLADPVADGRLATALLSLKYRMVGSAPLSLALRARAGRPAALLHLVPTRTVAQDIFAGALALALITPPQGRPLPDTALLGELFELSPREAALALGIGRGDTLKAYADEAGVTANTVKSQLKQVFEKTGVRRQAELLALLARLSGP